MIVLKGIDKIYKNGNQVIHALKDLSLEIEAGEIFGIIGRPNSGKSTLLRTINLLERPNNGSVNIDNCPLTALNIQALRLARRNIGLVTKLPSLISSRNIYKNIALPLELAGSPNDTIDRVLSPLLNLIGLADKANLLPQDLNLLQKQRVSLIRALVHHPKVLLCDDITANFDPKSSLQLMNIIRDIHENLHPTIVIATQDIEIIKTFCHRVAVLHQGQIIETGSVVDLFTQPKTEIAKEFVKSATRLEMPMALRRRLRSEVKEKTNPVLRLSFLGPTAKEPVIADLIQQFGLTLNIIQAHLETISDKAVGIMIVEVMGQKDYIEKAMSYLESKGLNVEVLGYVSKSS